MVSPEYGNYPAIILPFNWGDNAKPDSARLADGTPFPIIPVNARLSRLVYGIETFDEVTFRFTIDLLEMFGSGSRGRHIQQYQD